MALLSILGMGARRKRLREEAGADARRPTKAARHDDLQEGHDGLDELTQGGEVRAVEVDQREFITKMLARYEGHYFCLRELMQNADDAGASMLTVRAFTAAGEGVTSRGGCATAAAVQRLEVCNDGQAFTAADWRRVQTIAQGNPNEKTVGMFGVGFYSVFSLTDRPMVVSNGTAADMFYRGQQLYVCTKSSPEILERYGKETSIVLRMKQEKDFLLHELRQYLHDSIFFSRTLAYIRFVVDGQEVFTVEKACRPVVAGSRQRRPIDLLLCPFGGEADCTFQEGELAMTVEEVAVHKLVVSCTGLGEEERQTAFTLVEASVAVDASEEFRGGCRAVLSKNIEKRTTVQVLVQEQRHLDGTAAPDGLFYVGAPTGERTGSSMHVAAHLYPTMERIKIDLTHQYLRVWNSSLMRVAGFLCKALYRWRLEVQPLQPSMEAAQLQACLADMFGFLAHSKASGESSAALILAESFFNDSRLPMLLATSCGLARAEATYLPDEGVAAFLDCSSLNCFSTELLVTPAQRRFVDFLKERNLVLELSPSDLRSELSQSVLDVDRLIAFLQWYRAITRSPAGVWKAKAERTSLLKHVFYLIGQEGDESPRCLRDAKYFAGPEVATLPCPKNCLPSQVAGTLPSSALESKSFLGLQRMDVSKWLVHFLLGAEKPRGRRGTQATTTTSPSRQVVQYLESPRWAPPILAVISRHCSSLASMLNKSQMGRLWLTLKSTRCIPCTQRGSSKVTMTLPAEATIPAEHFANESCLFVALEISDDTVMDAIDVCESDEEQDVCMEEADAAPTPAVHSVSRALLKKLGVRLYPALDSYLLASEKRKKNGESSHAAMVRRLTDFAKMGTDMTDEDLSRVRELAFLSCTLAGTSEEVVCCASECYWLGKRAAQSLHELAAVLRLPVVSLDRAEHPKLVRFLVDRLKVASSIRQADLIKGIMAEGQEEAITKHLLSELFKSFSSSEYKRNSSANVPFLQGMDGKLHMPAESYLVANPFGCVVADSLQLLAKEVGFDLTSLGVREEPRAVDIIARLDDGDRPLLIDSASSIEVLEYLALRAADFSSKELKAIGKVPFLPVQSESAVQYLKPANLLLRRLETPDDDVVMLEPGSDSDSDEQGNATSTPWQDFLPMVDLGSAAAHDFLHKCGAVYEPSAEYIVGKLMDKEVRQAYFSSPKWSSRRYLGMLEYVASHFARLPKSLLEPMRHAPFLLAYKDNAVMEEGRIAPGQPSASLVRADACYFGGCRVWAQHLNAAHVPYDASEALMAMYGKLGTTDVTVAAKQLSSAVRPFRTTERSLELQERIRSRAPLLLHSKSGKPLTKLKKNAEALLEGIVVREAAAIEVALQLGKEDPVVISACHDRFVCSVQVEGSHATLYTPAGRDVVYLEVGNQLALLTSKGADLEERGGLYCAVLGGDLGGLEYMGFVQVSKVREARGQQLVEAQEVAPEQERQDKRRRLLQQRRKGKKQSSRVLAPNILSRFFSRSRPFSGDRVLPSSHKEVRAPSDMDYMCQLSKQRQLIRTTKSTTAGKLTLFVAESKDEVTVVDGGSKERAFEEFGELLEELWGVVPTSPLKMFHIYYDTKTKLVAFNTSGSLFFSLVKYMSQVQAGRTRDQLLAFWFTTLCHELAHNIESDHNKNHEAAMEQLVTAFLPSIAEVLVQESSLGSRRTGDHARTEAVVDLLSDDEEEEQSLVGSIISYFAK